MMNLLNLYKVQRPDTTNQLLAELDKQKEHQKQLLEEQQAEETILKEWRYGVSRNTTC